MIAPRDKSLLGKEHGKFLSTRRFKLTLIAFTVILVVALSLFFFVLVDNIFARMAPAVAADLRWKAERGAAELARSAELGILLRDSALVEQNAFAGYRNSDDIVALVAVDSERQPIATHGETPAAVGDVFTRSRGEVHEVGSYLVTWAPTTIEGTEVGAVAVVVSKERLRADRELRSTFLLVVTGGGLLAVLLGMFFINFYIGPLVRLTEKAFTELREKTRQALESARLKSEFVSNISHELRTPMHGVLGMLDLLLQSPLDEQQKHYGQVASSSARALMVLLDEILDFSRLESGTVALSPGPVDMRAVVEEVTQVLDACSSEANLTVSCAVAPQTPALVRSDTSRLRQVLLNLGGNAVKFTEQGEVVLSVDCRPAGDDQVRLCFAVRDTGPGIAESARELIFQAFTQVDGSLTRRRGGAGIGLTASRAIIDAMGGELRVDSEVGKGSTFWFELTMEVLEPPPRPAQSETEESEATEAEDTAPSSAILVVEDNRVNQLVLKAMLESAGYRVMLARDGVEAVEATAQQTFSLVLMDCQMPNMDGYTATRIIREREADEREPRHIPILACTAHAHADERERALAAGMDDFLIKPVSRTQLVGAVVRWTSEMLTPGPGRGHAPAN